MELVANWAIKKTRFDSWRWNFQGYWRNSKSNFQGLIKNNVEFQGWSRKNHVEFPGVLVLGLKISEGCCGCATQFCGVSSSAIGWSFVLSGISRGKVRNLKIPGEVQKSVSSTPPPTHFFSGIAHYISPVWYYVYEVFPRLNFWMKFGWADSVHNHNNEHVVAWRAVSMHFVWG